MKKSSETAMFFGLFTGIMFGLTVLLTQHYRTANSVLGSSFIAQSTINSEEEGGRVPTPTDAAGNLPKYTPIPSQPQPTMSIPTAIPPGPMQPSSSSQSSPSEPQPTTGPIGGDSGGTTGDIPGVVVPTTSPYNPTDFVPVVPNQPLPVQTGNGSGTINIGSPDIDVVLVNQDGVVTVVASPHSYQGNSALNGANTSNSPANGYSNGSTIPLSQIVAFPTSSSNSQGAEAGAAVMIDSATGEIINEPGSLLDTVVSLIPFLPSKKNTISNGNDPSILKKESIGRGYSDEEYLAYLEADGEFTGDSNSQTGFAGTSFGKFLSKFPFASGKKKSSRRFFPQGSITVPSGSVVLNSEALDIISQWLAFNGITIIPLHNGYLVKHNNASTFVAYPLAINMSKIELSVRTPSGYKGLSYLPERAIQILKDRGSISNVVNPDVFGVADGEVSQSPLEIVTLHDTPTGLQYEIEGISKQYCLAVLPCDVKSRYFVSADTLEPQRVVQSTFNKILDFIAI